MDKAKEDLIIKIKKRNPIFLIIEIVVALFVIFFLYFSYKNDNDINFVMFFLLMSLFSFIRTIETKAKSHLIVFSIFVIAAIFMFVS
ncbi:hypothetical protein FHS16_001489 [Paenibacillus endophyticus]|uniref:Uncharacterized protein n=1 Tax=Paenibacillus endophyticus TaxID=1294268 RepID=A0A7W5C5G2_9BACL|nr:hypothetical protein [Paenibacillus endophyticus]